MSDYSILFIRSDEQYAHKIEAAFASQLAAASGSPGEIEWVRVDALFDGLRVLQERSFNLILSDLFLPDGQGLATLRHLSQQAPTTPIIVICHASDRDTAVNAVRKGAHDFFCYEDFDPANFFRSVTGALNASLDGEDQRNAADRRTNARFPCRLAVSYQALEHPFFSGEATSETLNISSKGMLFTTTDPIQPGQLLQVSVDWPARLENQVPLKLVAEGRIVRNINGQAAMRIDKYEFRTRRAKTPVSPAPTGQPKTSTGSIQQKPANRPTEAVTGAPKQQESTRPGTAAGNRTVRKGASNA